MDQPAGEAEAVFGILLGDAHAKHGGNIGTDLVLRLGVIPAVEDEGNGRLVVFLHHERDRTALFNRPALGAESGNFAPERFGGRVNLGAGGEDRL